MEAEGIFGVIETRGTTKEMCDTRKYFVYNVNNRYKENNVDNENNRNKENNMDNENNIDNENNMDKDTKTQTTEGLE